HAQQEPCESSESCPARHLLRHPRTCVRACAPDRCAGKSPQYYTPSPSRRLFRPSICDLWRETPATRREQVFRGFFPGFLLFTRAPPSARRRARQRVRDLRCAAAIGDVAVTASHSGPTSRERRPKVA